MAKASVIIPVYNAEKYLKECLDSVVHQTLRDIEIICVDDGSTDSSYAILQEYAKRDNRFLVWQQANQGAACARNYGMSMAKGKYLLFLDSDDVFSTELIEKAVIKAELFDADVTAFKAVAFNTNNGHKAVMKDYITGFSYGHDKTFSYVDIPDRIFNSFLIPAWNKLLKKSFVNENNITFQNVKRYNDMLFSSKALALASKIILLDEVLLCYRVGMKSNLQARKDKTPLEVYKPLMALKIFLEEKRIYEKVEKSFLKLVLDNIFYNLNDVKSEANRELFVNKLRSEIFALLGVNQCADLKAVSFWGYLQYKYICVGNNKSISSGLYALDKLWEYYRLTGFKNMINKMIIKILGRLYG